MPKLVAFILISLGEALAILVEITAARQYQLNASAGASVFLKFCALFAIAGGFLVGGYMLGLRAFKNIWVVSAISITTLLVLEPILAYTIIHQLPTRGALIGFVLGILGMISALVL